jgi:hypothetical protein
MGAKQCCIVTSCYKYQLMKLRFFAFILFSLLLSQSLFSQNLFSVKGSVVDTSSSSILSNSCVTILKSSDSLLVSYTWTNSQGAFEFDKLDIGNFLLLVTYPGYADYVEFFSLDSLSKNYSFGQISLSQKSKLLEEFVVKGRAAAVEIKGDTTEFNAGSFKIDPNSKVEDLLKQLPGIQVDRQGKITAYGQIINKVLVDGEEFFGDDPTLVTRNLRGEMVDKVQLYDRKSDQAMATGVEDGNREKTINIKLKEDKKYGYFGKVEGLIGTKGYYEGQGMFNSFTKKNKFAVYGTAANTGRTGLGRQDKRKYAYSDLGGNSDGILAPGDGLGSGDLDTYSGNYSGQGFPSTKSGGIHYDTKWNDGKKSLNSNYKIGSINLIGSRSSLIQNNLPTGIINSRSDQTFDNFFFRQKIDGAFQVQLDSTSSLKVVIDGTANSSRSGNGFLSRSSRNETTVLNESDRTISNIGSQQLLNATEFWVKKLRKQGRSVSVNLRQVLSIDQASGYLYSRNKFYGGSGQVDSIQVVDQFKNNDSHSLLLSSNLSYTEPLTKKTSLALNYGLGFYTGSSNRKSFNKSESGTYSILDSQFSNEFELKQAYQQGGATFNYITAKTNLNLGTRFSSINFKQLDRYTNSEISRTFNNWYPKVAFSHNFSREKAFDLSYEGNPTQPGLSQIQPLRVNTDPLNIVLGNPDLAPSYTHKWSVFYNSYKVVNNRNLLIKGSYSFTNDPIVDRTTTDLNGVSNYQAVNLSNRNAFNIDFYSYYFQNVKQSNVELGIDLIGRVNTFYNVVNDNYNRTISNVYTTRLTAGFVKRDKLEIMLALGPEYNVSRSSLQKQTNNDGWGLNSSLVIKGYLPGKIQFSSDLRSEYRERTQSFSDDFRRVLWDVGVNRKFLKKKNLRLELSVNDLLNQNVGFTRTAYSNFIAQNSYTTIKRYFMFSVVFDFDRMGGSEKK